MGVEAPDRRPWSHTGASVSSILLPLLGIWTPTAAMNFTRRGATATTLANGRVLVVGGQGSNGASSEEYNPVTGTWVNVQGIGPERAFHTATLLTNGQVLVAGGFGPNNLTSAALYNPATGTWQATGSMATGHAYHAAALLPDGQVLVSGSINAQGNFAIASAEVYDPATGTWHTTGSLLTARFHHTATTLPTGEVLVAGGDNNLNGFYSTEIYNPSTGLWRAGAPMFDVRSQHTATLLTTSEVLVASGYCGCGSGPRTDGRGDLISAELFDPAATAMADLSAAIVDTPDPVKIGQTLHYEITIANAGPSRVTNLRFTDTLDKAVKVLSLTANGGATCNTRRSLSCTWSTMSPEQEFLLVLEVRVTAAGILTNTATVQADQADPQTANNTATATTTVTKGK